MSKPPQKIISDIGKQLGQQSRLSKDFLVKSLRQAASVLLELDQLPSLEPSIRPLSQSIVKHGLLHHKDKDVRLLVAVCSCEIIRVLAPKPSFDDTVFKDIFELFVSMFAELADTTSPYFSRRVKILETVATLKCCVKLLDLHCVDLILKMFNTFFSVVRKEHQQSLISSMLSIMSHVLTELGEEEVPKPLLEVILRNLRNNGEDLDRASYHLAIALVQDCAKTMKPAVCGFLRSCISDRESVQSDLKECFHEIIFEIFQCVPDMLLADIPNLALELVSDQVDVRIKSVNLIGKLLALAEDHAIHELHYLFVELLKRFSDKSAEVRISVIRAVKSCYMANPFTLESQKILSSLEGRLLDLDASVRIEAIAVVCDLAKLSLKNFPEVLISRAIDRFRDKMTSVRKEALKKLLEVYREYCTKCHERQMTLNVVYEQIPCKILMLCGDKNLKEFSSQNLELLLAADLFPACLPQDDVMVHWIYLYSLFTPAHVKSLNLILCQKRRFQTEMQSYLSLRLKAKGISTQEVDVKIKNAFNRMSALCPNAVKAGELFDKLNLLKDDELLLQFSRLLEEREISRAKALRENLLKDIGKKHPLFEFCDLLSLKCLNNIFCSEHVKYILDHISGDSFRDDHQEEYTFNLLSDIARNFPKLMRGSEQQFKTLLLEQDAPWWGKLLQILAKVVSYMTMELSDIYPLLERLCLEGTRAQSKTAISVIASLLGPAEHFLWVDLCQKLVQSLHNGQNLPTVLQSLGCISQHAVVAYQKHKTEIFTYIRERIFGKKLCKDAIVVDGKTGSKVSFHCKLKIFGLKTLVKSILPMKVNHEEMQIINLLDILSKLLLMDDLADVPTCENDVAHLRLAAAKSVLWISRRWETHISPHICESVILMAKDTSSFVRNAFLDKTHKLLKQRTASRKFACAFALAASDCAKDLQDKSLKYLIEFIKEDSKAAHTFSASGKEGSMIDSPAYIMVFLLHILAHDVGYPCASSDDDEQTVQFFRPLLLLLHVLVNSQFVDGDFDLVKRNFLYLRSIFRAIRRAEDAVDHENTPKLHMLAEAGMYVLNALKHDNINLYHAPGLVLLPSSLYKTSEIRRSSEDTSSPAEWVVTDNLLKKLVQVMKCDFFQLSSSTVKRSKKFLKDITTSKQDELQRKVTTDKNISEKEITSTYILEACPKAKEQSETVHSTQGAVHNGSSLIGEVEADNIENIASLRVQEHHADSECATLDLFEIESDISTQEMDVSLSISQKEDRKRKNSNEFTECLDHGETNIRKGRISDGSTVSFSQRFGTKKQYSDDIGKKLVTISGQGSVNSQGSQTNQRKVLLDKTNSLSVNGLMKQRKLKKSCLGLEISLDTSESDVSHENKDSIAFRTRRKKA